MKIAMMPENPPTNGAWPVVQFFVPGASVMVPKIMRTPTARNTRTVMTLIEANRNSLSPKARTLIALMANRMAKKTSATRRWSTSGAQ